MWIAGIILGAALGAGVQEAREGHEEECKDAFEAFRKAYVGKPEASRVQAVIELGKHGCEKAIHAIVTMLDGEALAVRAAAARTLGGSNDPHAVEALARAVPANAQNREVLAVLARALETLDWELGAEALNPLLGKHHDKDVLDALDVVVPVLGRLGSPSSVEPLIKLLEHAENEGRRVRAAGVRAAGNPKMQALEAPVKKALKDITGGSETTADKWDDWWKTNRERLLAGMSVVYRCKATGKRWGERAGVTAECPFHDKPAKDGQPVKTKLVAGKS